MGFIGPYGLAEDRFGSGGHTNPSLSVSACVCCTTVVVVHMGFFKLNRTHQYYLSYCKLDLVQLFITFVDINLVLTVKSKILQQILF